MAPYVYDLLMLGVVALVVRSLHRRSRADALTGTLLFGSWALGLAAAVSLAFVLGRDVFDFFRLLGHGIFLHGVGALALSAWVTRRRQRRFAAISLTLAVTVLAIGVHAYFIEPYRLEVTRLEIRTEKITRSVRIALIADLQTDDIGEYEARALEEVAAAAPDLVLWAGDYVHEWDPDRYALVSERFRELVRAHEGRPSLGAYAVEGNAEHGSWPLLFDGTSIHCWRTTRTTRLELEDSPPLYLTGLSVADSFQPGLRLPERDGFHIVFGHGPDFALSPPKADLLLAGHTHGGQVQLPFIGPLLTLSHVPRGWASGVTTLENGATLVVSRGVGMERELAPRLRFLCRPEIVLVDLIPDAAVPPYSPGATR